MGWVALNLKIQKGQMGDGKMKERVYLLTKEFAGQFCL
jgi:hypothetical protein